MKTTLRKSTHLDDWYVIEPFQVGQPEGIGDEWKDILGAMQAGVDCVYRRVGLEFDLKGNAWFYSPRNSLNEREAMVPKDEVGKWIEEARKILE